MAGGYFPALSELVALLEETGASARAREYARWGLAIDPLREETARELIRLLAGAAEREAAQTCATLGPSPATWFHLELPLPA